jgi:HlyD family secretion protein
MTQPQPASVSGIGLITNTPCPGRVKCLVAMGPPRNGGTTLQKYFRYRKSCYVRNEPGKRRRRTSVAASSVVILCVRRIPTSASASTPTLWKKCRAEWAAAARPHSRSNPLDRNREHISYTALGLNDVWCARVAFELASQTKNLHINAAIENVLMHARSLQQVLAAERTLRRIEKGETLQLLVEQQEELSVQKSHLHAAEAAVAAIRETRGQTVAEYRRTLSDELAKAEQKANGLTHDLIKAEQKTRLQQLAAPADGVVQQLAIHTVGGVVTPAQSLLVVVPSDSRLEIEAMVSNRDIGFVQPGQDAEIKIDTFNFTRSASCTARCSASRRTRSSATGNKTAPTTGRWERTTKAASRRAKS